MAAVYTNETRKAKPPWRSRDCWRTLWDVGFPPKRRRLLVIDGSSLCG